MAAIPLLGPGLEIEVLAAVKYFYTSEEGSDTKANLQVLLKGWHTSSFTESYERERLKLLNTMMKLKALLEFMFPTNLATGEPLHLN